MKSWKIVQTIEKTYHDMIHSLLSIYNKYYYQIHINWIQQLKRIQYVTQSFTLNSIPSNKVGAVGLENLGNTCFLNAMLQALASLPSMRKYVENIASYEEQSHKLSFIRKLSKCFKDLRSHSGVTVSARDIYLRITTYRRGLGDFEQQDAGECLQALIGIISNEEKALLSQLHCSVKYLFFSPQSSRSLPPFPFNGLVSSVVTCHKCNHSRPPRIQSFTELSLPVEAPISTPQLSIFPSTFSNTHNEEVTTLRSNGEVLKLQRLSDCLGRFAAGEILSDVECLTCSYKTQMESFQILTSSSWASESQNLKSLKEVREKIALLEQNHASEKRLEELIPESERERTTATKQLMVSKFPEILCFQLIRNIFDMKLQRMIKLRHHISFPIEFHENDMCIGLNYRVTLSPNVHSQHGLHPKTSSSSLSSSTGSVFANENEQKGKLYHLYAVIVHHGGSESGLITCLKVSDLTTGHYTTYARVEGDNSPTVVRKWAHFSDEIVREVDEKEVLGCEAYLLFYHRVPSSPELNAAEMKVS